MLEKQIDDLESRISYIEDRLEEDCDFLTDPLFEGLYNEMIDFLDDLDLDFKGFPDFDISEKRVKSFEIQKKRFLNLKKRMGAIKNDADIEF